VTGDDLTLMTFDVRKLYESIVHAWLIDRLSQRISRFYRSKPGLASLVTNFLTTVINAQHTSFGGQIFRAIVGIGTGLACGVFLANILLDEFDEMLTSSFSFAYYGRFVDDGLAIVSSALMNSILQTANAWHECIVVDLTGSGDSVDFLDLTLSLHTHNSIVSCSSCLYRKPLNIYQYLPRSSCHSASVFRSVIFSEAIRILRKCSFATDAELQFKFFHGKLLKRGYATAEIMIQFKLALASHANRLKRRLIVPSVGSFCPRRHVRKAFFKVRHSGTVNYPLLTRSLSKHMALIPNTAGISCAKSVQHSLFRIMCPFTWRRD
jgi:hypothetical protein